MTILSSRSHPKKVTKIKPHLLKLFADQIWIAVFNEANLEFDDPLELFDLGKASMLNRPLLIRGLFFNHSYPKYSVILTKHYRT